MGCRKITPFLSGFFLMLWFVILQSVAGYAQYHNFRINTIEDQHGNKSGATFAIAEDPMGFLWFGTLNGLIRYDGFNYRYYMHDKDDDNTLTSNMIRTMFFDQDGLLWIGTQGGGVNVFNPISESFVNYRHDPDNPNSLGNDVVWAITDDDKGNVWVGTWGGGLSKINKSTGEITRYHLSDHPTFLSEDGIRSLLVDDQGYLWIGMHSSGLVKYHIETGDYSRYFYRSGNQGKLAANAIYKILQDQDRHIWLATFGGGLHRYDSKNDSFILKQANPDDSNSLASDFNFHMTQSQNGDFWIANEWAGINIFDAGANRFSLLVHDQCDRNSLSSSRIRYIYEDSNGIIWAGNEVGVDRIIQITNFTTYRHIPNYPNSLNAPVVRSIYKDRNDRIWIGSFDTYLSAFDREKNRFIKEGKVISQIGLSGVTSMLEDNYDNFWLGTSNGVYVFDKNHDLIHHFLYNADTPTRLSDNTIQIIRKGVDGEIWVGAEGGLNVLNPATGIWRNFLYDPNDPGSISSDKIQPNALIIDENGIVWAGTWGGGLNKYLPDEDRFVRYMHDPRSDYTIVNNDVISLHKDEEGILWIGTFGGGLNRFDPIKEEFTLYTTLDGLPSNIIFAIHQDHDNQLWLSTDYGLSRFCPANLTVTNFDETDGLPGVQFFWGSSFQAADGELFFCSTEGMVSFYPENIDILNMPPQVKLTNFLINNTEIESDKAIPYVDHFILDHSATNILLEFTALDLRNPSQNRFAYSLSSMGDERIYLDNRNNINFSSLKPGNHLIRIMAANNEGVWNDEGILITLSVKYPYWQTFWFRSLVILAIFSALYGFYIFRTHNVKQQKVQLENLVGLRTQELEGANDQLKNANEELLSQREMLRSTLDELQNAQKQLVRSEKMASLGVLAAGVAHEINNPLNFIHGGATALQEVIQSDDEDKEENIGKLVNIIFEGVKRASSIVGSLSNYSRIQDLEMSMHDMHAIVESCLIMLQSETKNRIEVQKDFCEPVFKVLCNEGKMHQAILNILLNAVQAIEKNGTIKIRSFVENDFFVLSVSDNGCGISEEHLLKITDPFFTTKEPGKGTGLGLSVTQRIMEEHKGLIEFTSTQGLGTTVLIKLPFKS